MKKNRFWVFILGLIPGCGLMCLGYMKKGLQYLLMFFATLYVTIVVESYILLGELGIFFILLLPIVWIYQMFDTMHTLTHMRKHSIETPTDDGFFIPAKMITPIKNRTIVKFAAIILIVIGASGILYSLLNNLHYVINEYIAEIIINTTRNYLVPGIVSLALIIIGVKLLKGSGKDKSRQSLGDGKGGNL